MREETLRASVCALVFLVITASLVPAGVRAGQTIIDSKVMYPDGQSAARTGDRIRVVITLGINAGSVSINAGPIGGSNNSPMFDDGMHEDGNYGDRTWGSAVFTVKTNITVGYKRLMITIRDGGGNVVDVGSVNVGVDNYPPTFGRPWVLYPSGQMSARKGDRVRFLVNVTDPAPRMNVDAILAIDRSGSMTDVFNGRPKIDWAKDAAKLFVSKLNLSLDRGAVFSFADAVTMDQGFTNSANALNTAIDSLSAGGSTKLYDATHDAVAYASGNVAKGAIAAVILLTDGMDTSSSMSLNALLAYLSTVYEIPVFTIGLGNQVDENVLRSIARTSDGGEYYYAPTPGDLDGIYTAIANLLLNRPYPHLVSKVFVDTSSFADIPTWEPLYDDGKHGDQYPGDDLYGSEWLTVGTNASGPLNTTLVAYDSAANIRLAWVDLLVDNTPPGVLSVDVRYPGTSSVAREGDLITVQARVSDALLTPSFVERVTLNASSIGAGTLPMLSTSPGTYEAKDIPVRTGNSSGMFPLVVTVYDDAGNSVDATASVHVDNDVYSPVVTVLAPVENGFVKGMVNITASVHEDAPPPASVHAQVSTGNGTTVISSEMHETAPGEYVLPVDGSLLADGTYTLIVTAVDRSGNQGGSSPRTFRVDNTPPEISLLSPEDPHHLTGTISFDIRLMDANAIVISRYAIDGGEWVPLDASNGTATVHLLTRPGDNGLHNITIYAEDENGNVRTSVVEFSVSNPSYALHTWSAFLVVGIVATVLLWWLMRRRASRPVHPAAPGEHVEHAAYHIPPDQGVDQ